MKRIFKGPLIWIVVAVVGVLIAMQFLISSGGGDEISASQMSEYISSGEVKDITFVDGDQVIKATLDDSVDRKGGREVTTKYLTGTQDDIFRAVAAPGQRGHDREGRPSRSPGPGLLSSFIFTLPADHPARGAVPLADELHAGRRRPRRHAVRQVQGEADLQGHAQDDVRRRRRLRRGRSRSSARSRSSSRSPPSSRPWAPRSPRACCCTARPAPARRCWPARWPARPACRSTRSPAPTSSRCSSASAPPGSATCSSRPRRTRRRSSSSTRSTPSAGTAAPAWAAATTSASRPSTSCWSRWTASTCAAA